MRSDAPNYIRTSISRAIESISYPDTVIQLREVTITNETTIESLCRVLLPPDKQSLHEAAARQVNGNQLMQTHEFNEREKEKDDNTAPITFLLDASGFQLRALVNLSKHSHLQKQQHHDDELNSPWSRDVQHSLEFNARYGVPGLTLIDSTWLRDISIPLNQRQWNLIIKTPAYLLTSSLVKDLIIEYAIRRLAILYDASFGQFSSPLSLFVMCMHSLFTCLVLKLSCISLAHFR